MIQYSLFFRSRNCSLLISSNSKPGKCHSCQDLLEHLGQKDDDADNFDYYDIKEDLKVEYSDEDMNEDEVEMKPKVISFSNDDVKSENENENKLPENGAYNVCPYCSVTLHHYSKVFHHVRRMHREKLEHYGENYAKNKKRFWKRYEKFANMKKSLKKEGGKYKPSGKYRKKSDEPLNQLTNCPYCTSTLANLTSLYSHIKSLHEEQVDDFLEENKSRVKKCPYCEVVYFSKLSITRHVKKDHKELLEDYAKNHAKHAKAILGIKGHAKCPYCTQTYSTKATVWRHVLEWHKEMVDDYSKNHEVIERKYDCPFDGCAERFSYEKLRIKHAFEKHGITITSENIKPDIECPFCDEKFRGSRPIPAHLEANHANESENPVYIEFYNQHQKTEVCQECGKVFKNLSSFSVHMRETHSDVIDSYFEKCEICGKNYKNKVCLQQHMKTHEECESLCIECGKSYPNKTKLQTHINIHHSNKSFSCPECFQTFKTNAKLAKHVRKTHLNEKIHPCKLCDKAFNERKKIVEHMVAVHLKVKPFLCEFCNFECARLDNLSLHRKKSHGAVRITKLQFLALVDSGKHPYYDQEKIELLKAVCANESSLFQ